jgi:formamidopyrimidine-DNA glycosylase
MPELPEVETIRRGIEKIFVGREIESIEVTGMRSVRRHSAEELVDRVTGRRLDDAARKGKFLLMRLDSGDVLVAHMGMSGRMLQVPTGEARLPHTHVALGFAGGIELWFVDPRTFGQMFVSRPGPDGLLPELADLGFDPIAEPITAVELGTRLRRRRTRLKPLLMDQRFVAGIGNIYSDEILFAARLAHERISDTLSPAEARRLHTAMNGVLEAAIAARGSSLADAQYRDLYGDIGSYQDNHNVYGRAGQPCRRCRTPVAMVRSGGRSGFFCPRCQRR